MPSYALAAIGRDRPGIVAAVSKVLYEQGCNVEDSSMTLLRGNFAMMLVLAAPDGLTADALAASLRPACGDLGLLFDVLPVDDVATTPHPSHILTVYGADRPGILYRITDALAATAVNITDLNSRLVGEAASPVYAVMLELAVPDTTDVDGLEVVLRQLASDVGVDLTMRPLDEDVL
jgi:glycine cleavage system transcriptional repressor